ncbi:MAG: sterol desaturase family protein [Alphaproteobacteria bacterium]|nr:sterol desaturase family protein [Alphaproteobacteria bacterium]MCB9698119.1 sterol desaturase family protein [Alphaproteobacteria bacterium]
MNPIAVAIPLFFVSIGVELGVARVMGRSVYRFADAVTDLSCGISQQVTGVLMHALLVAPYLAVYALTPLRQGGAWWVHLETFLLVDFLYWAWHRFTHETNIGWTTHVVHHQSEDYNLAVALRQSITSSWSSVPFYLPLAAIGIPPEVFFLHTALNTLYQFWIHTELVGRLGPLEWVLNTPSHHRVHHAVNRQYLDRNYAGVLIVWDRLFRTFEPEVEEPVYGTVEPMNSFNPLWANLWWFAQLGSDTVAAASVGEKLKLWISPPHWRPSGLPPHPEPLLHRREDQVKYDPRGFPGLAVHVVGHFVLVAVLVEVLLLSELTWNAAALITAWVLLTVTAWGAWFEGRRWAMAAEIVRAWLTIPALVAAFGYDWGVPVGAGVTLAILGFVGWRRYGVRPATA